MYNSAERNRLAQEQADLARQQDARAAELHRFTVGEKEDAARTRGQLYGLRTEMDDRMTGFDRSGFNSAANTDFDQMLAASEAAVKAENAARAGQRAGLAPPQGEGPPPQMPRISQDSEAGLRAQYTKAPDINSPEFRSGMAGLRARYALTGGDMPDFDRVTDAERGRINAADDSAAALEIQQNPTGTAAVKARGFINQQSKNLTTTVDDKTGITRFTVVKGDKAEDVFVNPSDLGKLAVGYRRLERGDIGGLDVIAGVNKDLAAAVREDMKLNIQVGGANNDAVSKIEKIKTDREEIDVKRFNARTQRDYYAARTAAEKMGSAQYFNGEDGNTYAVVPKMGAGGKITLETQRVNPEGVKLRKPGGEVASKPVEAPEEGKIMVQDGKKFVTDGLGGLIPLAANGKPLGILPSQRQKFLTKDLGMTPAMANELEISKDGRYLLVPSVGAEYDTQDPKDMARIKQDMLAFAAQDPVDYENRMLLAKRPAPTGIGPRLTNVPPDEMPSPYASPQAWQKYRESQK